MTGPAYTGFAARAAECPEAPCLQDAYGVVDRAALRGEVTRIAGSLAAHRPADEVIGIYLRRDRYLAAALLAVDAVGAAILPLDVAHPPARIRGILRDSDVRILVTTPDLAATLGGGPWSVVDAVGCRSRDWTPAEPAAVDRIGYVVYTSGSTGRPKGVAIGALAIAHFLACVDAELARFSGEQIWQSVASVGFDSAIVDYYWTLSRGKFLVIGPSDPYHLFDSALATGSALGPVTHILLTPSTARLLSFDPAALAGLRRASAVLMGGEQFPGELVALLRPDGQGPVLLNVYGPAEATVWVTRTEVTADAPAPVPVGHPIPGVRLHLLGPDLRQVDPGTEGRLYLSGIPVGFGYWGRGGLTAAAFLPDPFAAGGARMYDTGDLGVWDPVAGLRVSGRVDRQVKIRGNRVELAEIEQVLVASPEIREAACVLHPEDGLVAYVVSADGRQPATAWLADRLPGYMLPNRVVPVSRLPRLANGKLDRLAIAQRGVPDR